MLKMANASATADQWTFNLVPRVPRVSPGDQPLTKEPEDFGYEIGGPCNNKKCLKNNTHGSLIT